MRICIASPSLDIYSETFIRKHVEHLPFDVLTLSGPRLDQTTDDWLPCQSFGQRLCHYLARKLRRFDEESFASDRQAAWMKQYRVRAVMAEYGFTGVAIAEACSKAGLPLIVHFHGYDAHLEDAVAPCRDAYLKLFQQAAAVVAVSWPMIERLVELGCERGKLIRIPYSVDPESFLQSQPSTNAPVFLSVGRFVEKKAPHLLLLAFAGVLRVFPEARLEMAGDGPLLGASIWQARALGIDHAVTFHGSKPHKWVAAAMQRVRAFVQHSVRAENGDSEGMPVAVLEAQCTGLPVIATRHAGIGEVVVSGQTGFLCDEGDVAQMTKYMIQLLGMSEEQINEMSRSARQRILTEFSKENTLDKLTEIIRTLGNLGARID